MMSPLVLQGNGQILSMDTPLVMGIINVTEDSFFPGSRVTDELSVIEKAAKMVADGADILDIGAMSSRPGAKLSDPDHEAEIIKKTVTILKQSFPDVFLSVDTVWSNVAEAAIQSGANMINDISAGSIDPLIWKVAADYNVPYVLMHMRGEPANMQNFTDYEDVVLELFGFFSKKIRQCKAAGIHQIIVDPGLGFSKTMKHNFTILKNFRCITFFEKPIMVGLSRKSFISKTLGIGVEEALNGTSILHAHSLYAGANLLRVHDVKEAKQAVLLIEMLNKG